MFNEEFRDHMMEQFKRTKAFLRIRNEIANAKSIKDLTIIQDVLYKMVRRDTIKYTVVIAIIFGALAAIVCGIIGASLGWISPIFVLGGLFAAYTVFCMDIVRYVLGMACVERAKELK